MSKVETPEEETENKNCAKSAKQATVEKDKKQSKQSKAKSRTANSKKKSLKRYQSPDPEGLKN